MSTRFSTPSSEDIALLEPFERLGLDRIVLVHTGAQARQAQATLAQAPVWGFDTESKPTFVKNEASDGPHTVQLATPGCGYVFQLHDPECRAVAAALLVDQALQQQPVLAEAVRCERKSTLLYSRH